MMNLLAKIAQVALGAQASKMKSYLSYAVIGLLGLILGGYIAYSHTQISWQEKMLSIQNEYEASVKVARNKEAEWRKYAQDVEEKYKAELTSNNRDNSELVDRLRKQLANTTCRVSTVPSSTRQSASTSRESKLSGEITRLVEFSNECSKRADSLIIQLKNLQEWANTVGKQDVRNTSVD